MTLKKNLEDEFPRMISTFHQLEENILKLMTRKQDIDREIETEEEEYIQEIKQMHKREKKAKEERDKLLSEYELNEKITKELNKQAGEEGKNSELLSMLMDLYVNLIYGEEKKKIKKEINPIKELTESLQHIEFDIIQYIDKLEKLEKTNKNFKNEVVKRKDYNKIKNQESIKRKVEELQILRKKKAEERMHRKIIKGKRVMPHLLITKEDKKFDKNNIANKDNDDLYIINYNEDS